MKKKKSEMVMNIFLLLTLANYFVDPMIESLRTKIMLSVSFLFLIHQSINSVKEFKEQEKKNNPFKK